MHFDRNRSRLELSTDEMRALVRMVTGDDDPAACDAQWVEAGIVEQGEVNAVAAGMIQVALDAPRASSIQRFDGLAIAPLFVGVDRHGRATLTEAPGSGAAADAAAWITATRIELLPALIMQAIRLHPGIPDPESRSTLEMTAREITDALDRLGSVQPVGPDTPTDDPIEQLLVSLDSGWQAAGGWQRRDADTFVTVLNAGRRGLWFVETEREEPLVAVDPDKPVRLVPCTVAEATARLGDVVTGRRAPRPAPQPA